MNETLNYWTPNGAAPSPVLPPSGAGTRADQRELIDWLTMTLVVCIAVVMAFSIVIAMAWVMGR